MRITTDRCQKLCPSPSADLSFSLLTHWRWGIKAKLDLGMTMQLEKRDRGWTFSTGFAPVLGVGWGYNF